MNTGSTLMVRIYLTESSNLQEQVIKYLRDEIKLRGVSVFRAISGFGETGLHESSLVDLSLDLPIVIEFFAPEEIAKKAISHLSSLVKPEHLVFWPVQINR